MKSLLFVILAIAATAHADESRPMQSFTANGLELSGAEYWPFHGTEEIQYPDDILWGFYPEAGVPPEPDTDPNPESASSAAVACAEQAYAELAEFFNSDQPLLHQIIANGEAHFITHKFYLWVNDYSRAADPYPHGMREAKFWYWARNPQVDGRTPGFWKWESTLDQAGVCHTPDAAQIAEYLAEKWDEISA